MSKSYIFLALFFFLAVSCIEITHTRPDNIPESTYFLGGVDGGVWVDTFRIETTMSFVVYSEFQGELLDTCKVVAKNEKELEDLLSRVVGYNGTELVLCTPEQLRRK